MPGRRPGDGKASRRAPLPRPAPACRPAAGSGGAPARPPPLRPREARPAAPRSAPESAGRAAPRPPESPRDPRRRATGSAAPEAISSSVPGLPGTASRRRPSRGREVRGDQRPRREPRLDDQHGLGQRGDDAVSRRELADARLRPRRVLGDQAARGGDVGEQRRVAIGIDDVDTAAEHGERRAAGVERAAVGRGVDPERAARDDREALARRLTPPARARRGSPAWSRRARRRSPGRGRAVPAAVPRTRAPSPAEASSPTRPESPLH